MISNALKNEDLLCEMSPHNSTEIPAEIKLSLNKGKDISASLFWGLYTEEHWFV